MFSEQYADWIPERLQHIDNMARLNFTEGLRLPLSPREYWERNCSVAATFMTPAEAGLRYEIGVDTMMWGSDFPHPEGTYPFDRESLRFTLHNVPADEVRKILGENPARIYNFDLEALQPIADRVGPTVEEIAQPLADDEVPDGFRQFSLRPDQDKELVGAGH